MTETTFSRIEDSYTETELPTPEYINPNTSNEDVPDSKETLHGSQMTSLEDNYGSLNDTTPSPTTPQRSSEHNNLEYAFDKGVRHKQTPTETLYQVRWYGY